jgi:hypothetical protein
VPPRRARVLVAELIARGREAGTPGAAAARDATRLFLTDLGFTVREQPFTFNAGVYRALPASGALLVALSLLEIFLLLRPGPAWHAAAGVMAFIAGALVITLWLLSGTGAPGHVRTDANLMGLRGDAPVRCWLVAHLDTKAQGHSMAGRLVTLWITVVAVAGLITSAWLRLDGPQPLPLAVATGAVGVLAGLLLSGGRLVGESPGARDNGSGLLAVLTAAEVTTDPGVGVLITGAEEFGLAGARAFVREHHALLRGTEVINVDTVDDEGTLFVVTHGDADSLAGRVRDRVAGLARVRGRRLPLGIMVDGVPLAGPASGTVTIGRLSWGTLRRMHTPRDDAPGYALATAELLGERLATPI